jgi:hypothetical protein
MNRFSSDNSYRKLSIAKIIAGPGRPFIGESNNIKKNSSSK